MKHVRVENVKLPVLSTYSEVYERCLKRAGIKKRDGLYFRIVRRSVDARDKRDVKLVYSAEFSDVPFPEESIPLKKVVGKKKILVVGFGPAGMFSALYLARAGFEPIVIERGEDVDSRRKSVDKFINSKVLDEDSNVQFGEGGAGTFSDGKLNTGVSGIFARQVLVELAKHGAPEEILYESKPHVGSDKLPIVVKNIRNEIISLGGKVMFSTKLVGLDLRGGRIVAETDKGAMPVDDVVLAIGHSARDTFSLLHGLGLTILPKQFAVGLRIEHKQSFISAAQYGEKFAPLLPPADYRLSTRKNERGVFTFCMCPGGYVIPSASEAESVVTNGMSNYLRDGENANGAVLCEVYTSDFPPGVLGGVEYQRALERAAFVAGGGDYSAPVQLVGDFLKGRISDSFGGVRPTYGAGTRFADLGAILPDPVTRNIRLGLSDFDGMIKGFASSDAVLTGVETRSSSPVRVLRGENLSSVDNGNVYPCGEGCGYAGGITSAAADGIRVAVSISEKYQ